MHRIYRRVAKYPYMSLRTRAGFECLSEIPFSINQFQMQHITSNDHVYYTEQHLDMSTVEAPKLPRSGCSRLFGVLACTVMLMCVWSFVIAIGLPISRSSRTQEQLLKSNKPLPSVLKRFLNLQRSTLPSHGVTPASLANTFPSWKTKSGEVDTDAFTRDIALAVSLIVERLPGNTYHTPKSHATHAENPPYEEDTDT